MKAILKIYLRVYSKKNFPKAMIALFFMMCDVATSLIIPAVTKNIFDNLNGNDISLPYIYKTGIIVVGIAVAAVITTIFNNIFAQHLSTKIAADLRKELFAKIQELSFSNVDNITSGTLMTVVTNDTSQIQQIIMMSFRAILRSPLTLIGSIIMAYIVNSNLFFIILVCVPLLGIAIFLVIEQAAPLFTKMQERIDELNTKLIETVSGAREIKSFVTEIEETKRFDVVNDNYANSIIKANKKISLMDPAITFISNIGIGTVLLVSAMLVSKYSGIQKTDMVGTISAYISYLQQIIMSLMMFSMISIQLSRGAVSATRINKVLSTSINIINNENSINDIVMKGQIEYKEVSFGYIDEEGTSVGLTLNDISFKIKPNETIGIIGSTGSGKTSLVQLLPRLYDVTKGEILIDGINVKDFDLYTLRNQISYVTQEPIIFSGTIASNIKQGKEDASKEEIIEAAKNAVAYEFIEKLENGFESEVTQGGSNLSGGQKQRLAIARALIRNPKILILDDSTSAVDAKSEAQIRENLRHSQKHTTLIVAQKISSIRDCDNIIVLDNRGNLDGFGTHEKLLATSKVYQEIYTSQFGGYYE